MGFLEYGKPLSWEETKKVIERVKIDGIRQLLHVYLLNRNREDLDLKWGDEMEYNLLHFDHKSKITKLYADAHNVIEQLNHNERADTGWPHASTLR